MAIFTVSNTNDSERDTIVAKARQTNNELIQVIKNTKIDTTFLYEEGSLVEEKIQFLADNCDKVLDVGKSSRHRFDFFKVGQAITMDINQYEDYPDIIDDICNIQNLEYQSFDGIVCMAVLEHVYAPHKACKNLHKLLKDGGYVLVYAPYLWRYHAPKDLKYQDYFRFSRDALAYLFKDFSEVTIYPFRGRYSTLFNLLSFWKREVENRFGQGVNRILDRFLGLLLRDTEEIRQASGYYVWARK